jgi:hypothetical protein
LNSKLEDEETKTENAGDEFLALPKNLDLHLHLK